MYANTSSRAYASTHTQRLRDAVKRVASPLLDAAGVFDRGLADLTARQDRWTILMYHRVVASPADDPFGLGMCVQQAHFAEQVDFIARNFQVIGLAEGAARLALGEALPAGALSITFDDGYLDNLELAHPVLARAGLPWTLFVATGGMDDGTGFWWDRVIAAFAATTQGQAEFGRALPALGVLPLAPAQRLGTLENVIGRLWDLPIEQALAAIPSLEQALGVRPQATPARLTRAQLRQMAGAGVEIGAHTVRHPNLNLLPLAEVEAEMQRSRAELSAMLDRPVDGFAYPGGRMNEAVIEAARRVGFSHAVSTVTCINRLPADAWSLGRVGMPDSPLVDFKRALHGIARRAV